MSSAPDSQSSPPTCMHCITCGGVTSYNSACSERGMGEGMLTSVSAWWPMGITNARLYYALSASQLKGQVDRHTNCCETWREPSAVAQPSTSQLRKRRGVRMLSVRLPKDGAEESEEVEYIRRIDALAEQRTQKRAKAEAVESVTVDRDLDGTSIKQPRLLSV